MPGRLRGMAGFGIIELLLVLVILGIVGGSLFAVLNAVQRDYVRQRDVNRSMQMIRAADISIQTVLRSAGVDPFDTGLAHIDPDPLGTGAFDAIRVVSDYNPPDGAFDAPLEDVSFWRGSDTLYVRWQAGADPQALAYPVDAFELSYFAEDGTALLDPADAAVAAAVEFTIVVQRGPRTATPDRFTGRVLLRNRL